MNWDDFRVFFEISKLGGLKKAARALDMHHTSCARRLNVLEEKLGTRLFDRLPAGYTLTTEGAALARSMRIIHDEFNGIERNLTGKDRKLEGPIKLSLTNGFAQHLLMPDIQRFMDLYPSIDLELNMTYNFSDLANREADVAIRHAKNPPLSLAGPRVGRIYWCAYASEAYLDTHDLLCEPKACHWLGWGDPAAHLSWSGKKLFPEVPVRGTLYSEVLQLTAAQSNAGIASLPCYIGDKTAGLRRIPHVKPEPRDTIWVLAHQDMIGNARVKTLVQFLKEAFASKIHLLEGREGGTSAS